MDDRVAVLAARQGGCFYRFQALEMGYTPREIDWRLSVGAWCRVRRGAYADGAWYGGLDDIARHKVRVHAVARALTGRAVVSHISAAVLLDLPLWKVDLRRVHVIREPGRSSRTHAGVVHHLATLGPDHVMEQDGLAVSTATRTVIDLARWVHFEAAVVAADDALRRRLTTQALLRAELERQRDLRGASRAARAVAFADGAAESVGESRARVLFADLGFPAPQLQKTVRGPSGAVVARCDFYFADYHTLGEFDGRIKYGRALPETRDGEPPLDPGEVVWREKQREDALRDLGFEVARVVWSDLERDRDGVRRRFERAFTRSEVRRARAG